jgi:CRP/FNR family cyclic AMP-dependent transcriptional regulator
MANQGTPTYGRGIGLNKEGITKIKVIDPSAKNSPPSRMQNQNSSGEVTEEKKSGLVVLETGESLFKEGDNANSLYIIQKGQLRLFRPKGKGFIELAVLRAGEVLGEMAYFADDEAESKRSCSADAISHCEVIEISFHAFAKTINNLNPWFKTIINTLASRLRKTNAKVKELETNSVSLGYRGGASTGYQFYKNIEIVRLFVVFFMVTKSIGENTPEGKFKISKNTLKLYAIDIFNIADVKFEEFCTMLIQLKLISMVADKDNHPNVILFDDLNPFRNLANFLNQQRNTTEDKKIIITEKGEILLEAILKKIEEEPKPTGNIELNIKGILEDFKQRGKHVGIDDLVDAKRFGLVTDILVIDSNKLMCKVEYEKLKSMMLPIKILNSVERINQLKTK